MLRRATTLIGVALLTMGLIVNIAGIAAAKPVACIRKDPRTGKCLLTIAVPGGGGGSKSKGGGGGSNTSWKPSVKTQQVGGSKKPQSCSYKGKKIGCTDSHRGAWYSAKNCYVAPAGSSTRDVASARPGYSLFNCTGPLDTIPRMIALRLAAGGGGGPAALPPPPPDPAVLAARAVAGMGLRAIKIGIVPKPGANSVGLVGMPTWMWVADPGPSTTGPITRSVSERGFTVRATATLSRIVWTMGDGHAVTCHGRGTPYRDAFGKQSSPTCGYTYNHQGRYAVSATSYWVVQWEGIGQTGEIPLNFVQTAAITVGEAQVIVR